MHITSNKRLQKIKQVFYGKGLNKGYELGWQMRQVEYNNKGFIIAGKLDQEFGDILRHN